MGSPTTCPKCNAPTVPGASFCGTCGAVLAPPLGPRCTGCGAELGPSDRFCGSCGQAAVPPAPCRTERVAPSASADEHRRSLALPLLALAAVVLAAGGVLFWLYVWPDLIEYNGPPSRPARPVAVQQAPSDVEAREEPPPAADDSHILVITPELRGEPEPLDVSGMGSDPRGLGEELDFAPPPVEGTLFEDRSTPGEVAGGAELLALAHEYDAQGNTEQALALYQEAAQAGSGEAMMQCALAISVSEKDPLEGARLAFQWILQAAEAEHLPGMLALGERYLYGIGTEPDFAKAREWLEKAAGKGSAPAMSSLGSMYDQGLGVAKDDGKALEWYRAAARGEDFGAQAWLRARGFHW